MSGYGIGMEARMSYPEAQYLGDEDEISTTESAGSTR